MLTAETMQSYQDNQIKQSVWSDQSQEDQSQEDQSF